MKRLKVEERARRIAQTGVFGPLGDEAHAALARVSVTRSLARGEQLWRRGEPADAAAIVLNGRLDVVRTSVRGRDLLLRSLGAHQVVGLSTVAGATHSADLVAGDDTDLLLVPGSALRDLFSQRPEAALRALAKLGELLAALTDEMEEQRTCGLEERLRLRIARLARGLREIRFTHEELAQQVGATRENVSRALKRLERRGVLRCRRGRLEILAGIPGPGR